jgi:hypothetical protein
MSDNPTKDFYIAILLFESTSESGKKDPMYQESFVLLQAANEEEAHTQAREHGRRGCVSYESAEGETIQWTLKHVVDVSQILDDELKHGSELYARHFKNYKAYYDFEPLLGGTVD